MPNINKNLQKLLQTQRYLLEHEIPDNYILKDFEQRMKKVKLGNLDINQIDSYQKMFEQIFQYKQFISCLPEGSNNGQYENFDNMRKNVSIFVKKSKFILKVHSKIHSLSKRFGTVKEFLMNYSVTNTRIINQLVNILSKFVFIRSIKCFQKLVIDNACSSLSNYKKAASDILKEEKDIKEIIDIAKTAPFTVIDKNLDEFMKSDYPLTPLMRKKYKIIFSMLKSIKHKHSLKLINTNLKGNQSLDEIMQYLEYIKLHSVE